MDIRNRIPADAPEVDALLDRCFGPARHRRTAALLRGGSEPVLARVMVENGAVIGSIALHPVRLVRANGARVPLLLLGPLVSDPGRRGEGIGVRLMEAALAWLDEQNCPSVLIGDAPYYGRFGYCAAATAEWRLPGPVDRARLLLRCADAAAFGGPASLVPAERVARAA
jgi:predicted N-acetyltransferase YhbS